MKNTLAHILSLWKLAINPHCILAGTIFWLARMIICFLLNSEVSVFLWGFHSSPCKTRPERTARWSFLKTIFVLQNVSLKLDATQQSGPWMSPVWGPDIAFQTPVSVTEKLWSLLFLSGHKSWPSRDENNSVFCLSQHCWVSMHLPLKAFKYLTYTFLNTPSGLSWSGIIPKKTDIKIERFPAIIISLLINYSISRHLWDIGELLCNKETICCWIF